MSKCTNVEISPSAIDFALRRRFPLAPLHSEIVRYGLARCSLTIFQFLALPTYAHTYISGSQDVEIIPSRIPHDNVLGTISISLRCFYALRFVAIFSELILRRLFLYPGFLRAFRRLTEFFSGSCKKRIQKRGRAK